ncbi:MAG: pyrimidine-nucleoside phosphorylase [Clostridia bacterium]|nr:pyrimidine-nucleoside phosphorylase [Clostridia bacterium]
MRMVDLIVKKKNGGFHTKDEIDFIVNGFTQGEIPDYQMSAWLMAVCFCGMGEEETSYLTMAMTNSGDCMDLSDLPGIKVDKHSTGGVGDTTTLVIAPIVAACGGTVAKMSGRGLGHTGGTLDKLESIPNMDVELPADTFKGIVKRIGVCVSGQTGNLVPADKLMYALRDVTGTVNSIPLIASSVMSKKLASGADAIVLDVKTGNGAFMQELEDSKALARTMVQIGAHLGRRIIALITDMDQPLGLAVGNGLEVREAVEVLTGKVKKGEPLYEICMLLAAHMLVISDLAADEEEGRAKAEEALVSGRGFAKLKEMVSAQGGDPSMLDAPDSLCNVREKIPVCAEKGGFVASMNAIEIGIAAQLLGAGRAAKNDVIDPAVGLVMHKRVGDPVDAGEAIATLYVNDDRRLQEAQKRLLDAVCIQPQKPENRPIVYGVIK